MANDRLYIRCQCGEVYLLAKWWGWPFEAFEGPRPLGDWLSEHQSCGREGPATDEMRIPWTLVNEGALLHPQSEVPHGK